jgi:hypothetical protein
MLLEISQPLVQEYLAIYRQNNAPECRERLDAQLQRLSKGAASQHPKRGGP